MISTSEPGALLAERLGIEALRNEGHDLVAACIDCNSSDGFRVHRETGMSYCHVCQKSHSRLRLAERFLGSERAAWDLLVELGLEQPRHDGNGHAAPVDPLGAICRAKRVPIDSFRAFGAHISGANCVTLPAYGPAGQHCTDFTIWTSGDEKQLKGKFAGKKPAGIFFPHEAGNVRLPKAGETWHVVEGPKDAAALHSLGLLACGLNTCKMARKFVRLFKGVDVVLVPDRDTAGDQGAKSSARGLFGVARKVRIATLPAELRDKGGEDVRDVLRCEGGGELVLQAIAEAREWKPPESDAALPEIIVGTDEHRVTDEAIVSIANHPQLFQRGGLLVRIVTETKLPKGVVRPADAPRIEELPAASLRELMASSARYFTFGAKDELKPVHPPGFAVSALAARGHWDGIRPLEFVTEAPILRPDGTILQTPGYDVDMAAIYRPNDKFPVIEAEPCQQDARFAKDELLEVVEDFPFEAEPHRSAWLASVLTPFAKSAFRGPAPLMLMDANVPGAGKGLLCDCTSAIVAGRDFARLAACDKDAEWAKQILAIGMAGDPLVLVDNVTGTFGAPSLDAALTAQTWTGRWLGQTRMVTCPLRVVWYATANNIVLKGDMPRRVLHVRLNSALEKPEERSDFRHPELLEWVKVERPRLVAAALTILRAYFLAGKPKQQIPPWGSFEGWSDLVRGAIVWLGMPDPWATRKGLSESSDGEANQLRQLIAGWLEIDPDGAGCKISDVLEALAHESNRLRYGTIRGAFAEIFNLKPGMLPGSKTLAMKMHHWKGRVIDGRRLEQVGKDHGIALWAARD